MRIKTITCHNVYNHGASLQEHALLAYLERLGHSAEAINYRPPYLSDHFSMTKVAHPFFGRNLLLRLIYRVLKFPVRTYNLQRKWAFDRFSHKFIPSTSRIYKNNEELNSFLPEADAYICGSDQIWNSFFENGKDPAFYLDFVPEAKLKISYAASFAIDALDADLKPFVKRMVSRLDHISVRERSGLEILEDLGINHAEQVLDPVFLLNREYWKDLAGDKRIREDYILIYDFDASPGIKEFALRLKSDFGWSIITVNQKIPYADRNYFLKGPEFFLSLVKNAQFVISNSFHAVAFSLIFEKNFVVFNRSDKINTRMRDLLRSLDLEHLLLTGIEDSVKLEDYSYQKQNVKMKLDNMIDFSRNFLNQSLNQ